MILSNIICQVNCWNLGIQTGQEDDQAGFKQKFKTKSYFDDKTRVKGLIIAQTLHCKWGIVTKILLKF